MDEHDLVVFIERHHRHRAEVLDDLAARLPATGHRDLVGPQREDLADVRVVAGQGGEFVLAVGARDTILSRVHVDHPRADWRPEHESRGSKGNRRVDFP